MDRTTRILRACKITTRYKGYYYLPEAVEIAREYAGAPFHITKDVYPAIAMRHHTSAECVERNIRTVIERCWRNQKGLIEEIMGYETENCPSNRDFIDAILYAGAGGRF